MTEVNDLEWQTVASIILSIEHLLLIQEPSLHF